MRSGDSGTSVGVGVKVAVGTGVDVGSGVADGGTGVFVGVDVGVGGTGVSVGDGVGVGGTGVFVGVGVGVDGIGVSVGDGNGLGDGVGDSLTSDNPVEGVRSASCTEGSVVADGVGAGVFVGLAGLVHPNNATNEIAAKHQNDILLSVTQRAL